MSVPSELDLVRFPAALLPAGPMLIPTNLTLGPGQPDRRYAIAQAWYIETLATVYSRKSRIQISLFYI